MPLSDFELDEIQKRNELRKQLKQAASLGPWEYDSWGFVFQSKNVTPNRRFGILVRPMTWFEALGPDRIDQGLPDDPMMLQQGERDGEYIAQSRDDGWERDIDTLLAEIRILRKKSK